MKKVAIMVCVAMFLGMVLIPGVVTAFNDQDLDRLKNTKKCPGCDLSGAPLSGKSLVEADLSRANLTGAKLSGAHGQTDRFANFAHLIVFQGSARNIKGVNMILASSYFIFLPFHLN